MERILEMHKEIEKYIVLETQNILESNSSDTSILNELFKIKIIFTRLNKKLENKKRKISSNDNSDNIDIFKQYMDKKLIFTNNYNNILKLSDVYENYKKYLDETGGEHIGKNKFIENIKKRKDIERYLKGGENKTAYKLCCFKFNYGDDKNDLDI